MKPPEKPWREFMAGLWCLGSAPFRFLSLEAGGLLPSQLPHEQVVRCQGTTDEQPENCIKAVTWNVFEGRGKILRENLETLADTHHLLLLQEAPSPEDSLYDHLRQLHYLYAPECFYDIRNPDTRTTGNMILSRYPLTNERVLDLPRVTWNYINPRQVYRRNALHATASGLTIWNTHLDIYTHRQLRAAQFAPVNELLSDRPTILGMDANTVYRIIHKSCEPVLTMIESNGLDDVIAHRKRLSFADHLFTNLLVENANELPMRGSDHKPISAKLRLKE
jgi:endonuclease/exonuclease/phosphatase family metal-dependent hydrolase